MDWYVDTTTRSMPASSWSGLSATTICMVEQLGLATMPRWASRSCGLTSETTRGTSGSMRQRDEWSMTTAPASAKRGAHSPETSDPAENSARSKPSMVSGMSGRSSADRAGSAGPSSRRPAERSDAKGTTSRAWKPR